LVKKKIDSPYKNPLLLVKLNPGEEIELTAITDINNENYHTIYSAVSAISFYKEENSNKFVFKLESRGQILEKKILLISIININKMFNYFLTLINNKELEEITEGIIQIDDDSLSNEIDDLEALSQLLVYYLHKHNNILTASGKLKHPLSKTLIFKFKIENIKKGNIINIIKECVNDINTIYKKIQNAIELKL
jgi:DNA-directed RNA polymerase subunit L